MSRGVQKNKKIDKGGTAAVKRAARKRRKRR
jgi:hypothetical protein